MMGETTSRHALPLLQPGQAQKDMWHNEALALADALLHPLAEGEASVPPADPVWGQSWLVAAGAAGTWSGHEGALACWTTGGWRFCAPVEGMTVWRRDAGCFARFDGNAWLIGRVDASTLVVEGVTVVRRQQPAIAPPEFGITVDPEARGCINQILIALRAHGLIAG